MIFPKWVDKVTPVLVMGAAFSMIALVFVFWYWFSPKNLNVGYQPEQPINYSHKLHAGALGIDCRYCHFTVDKAAHAAVPPTQVCMNCHEIVQTNSDEIKLVEASYSNNEPIQWVKVHTLPEHAYFNHSRHISAGVGCSECHGRIDQMEVVFQAEPLSMGWCLECHRNPNANLRPQEFITEMQWPVAESSFSVLSEQAFSVADVKALSAGKKRLFSREEVGGKIAANLNINPSQNCSACHR